MGAFFKSALLLMLLIGYVKIELTAADEAEDQPVEDVKSPEDAPDNNNSDPDKEEGANPGENDDTVVDPVDEDDKNKDPNDEGAENPDAVVETPSSEISPANNETTTTQNSDPAEVDPDLTNDPELDDVETPIEPDGNNVDDDVIPELPTEPNLYGLVTEAIPSVIVQVDPLPQQFEFETLELCSCVTRGPLTPFKLHGNIHFPFIKTRRTTTVDPNLQPTCPPCYNSLEDLFGAVMGKHRIDSRG